MMTIQSTKILPKSSRKISSEQRENAGLNTIQSYIPVFENESVKKNKEIIDIIVSLYYYFTLAL